MLHLASVGDFVEGDAVGVLRHLNVEIKAEQPQMTNTEQLLRLLLELCNLQLIVVDDHRIVNNLCTLVNLVEEVRDGLEDSQIVPSQFRSDMSSKIKSLLTILMMSRKHQEFLKAICIICIRERPSAEDGTTNRNRRPATSQKSRAALCRSDFDGVSRLGWPWVRSRSLTSPRSSVTWGRGPSSQSKPSRPRHSRAMSLWWIGERISDVSCSAAPDFTLTDFSVRPRLHLRLNFLNHRFHQFQSYNLTVGEFDSGLGCGWCVWPELVME